jgi:hypothetical protein
MVGRVLTGTVLHFYSRISLVAHARAPSPTDVLVLQSVRDVRQHAPGVQGVCRQWHRVGMLVGVCARVFLNVILGLHSQLFDLAIFLNAGAGLCIRPARVQFADDIRGLLGSWLPGDAQWRQQGLGSHQSLCAGHARRSRHQCVCVPDHYWRARVPRVSQPRQEYVFLCVEIIVI